MKEVVRKGVRRLKGRKEASLCGIELEMLKTVEVVIYWLTEFFNMVWRVGVAPGEWKNALIVPIH